MYFVWKNHLFCYKINKTECLWYAYCKWWILRLEALNNTIPIEIILINRVFSRISRSLIWLYNPPEIVEILKLLLR